MNPLHPTGPLQDILTAQKSIQRSLQSASKGYCQMSIALVQWGLEEAPQLSTSIAPLASLLDQLSTSILSLVPHINEHILTSTLASKNVLSRQRHLRGTLAREARTGRRLSIDLPKQKMTIDTLSNKMKSVNAKIAEEETKVLELQRAAVDMWMQGQREGIQTFSWEAMNAVVIAEQTKSEEEATRISHEIPPPYRSPIVSLELTTTPTTAPPPPSPDNALSTVYLDARSRVDDAISLARFDPIVHPINQISLGYTSVFTPPPTAAHTPPAEAEDDGSVDDSSDRTSVPRPTWLQDRDPQYETAISNLTMFTAPGGLEPATQHDDDYSISSSQYVPSHIRNGSLVSDVTRISYRSR
ncbi:hypothetical protein JAAARDRAFT_63206 [Jaapia argillacea MUCL 33604]|uniref:Uncharacterized protein n=1 Tax=Jaapia argillacea MUCL 33604 TaxID=933084 RepID=A0A067PJ33_9AGAM|nr:hypothetical protein JAAARDRAFT_63206 [Jaapia argillacea MUCL 33604]